MGGNNDVRRSIDKGFDAVFAQLDPETVEVIRDVMRSTSHGAHATDAATELLS